MMLGCAGYAVLRYVLELVRVDEAGQFGTNLSISQWVSLIVFSGSMIGLWWIYRSPHTAPVQTQASSGGVLVGSDFRSERCPQSGDMTPSANRQLPIRADMMLQRDRQPELMDDPKLPKEEHLHALSGLARLNRVSGIASTMYGHLRSQALAQGGRALCVLDVASGAGDVPIAWARRAKREGLSMQLTLLDASSVAVEEQRRRARVAGVDILTIQHDCLNSPLPGCFDVVTCSLFMHHLDDHQVVRLLQAMQSASDQAIVVSDLERSRMNLALIQVASRLLTRSHVVHTDSALSVRAAYTEEEFKKIAESALARPVRIQQAFPCRFVATFDEETVTEAVPAFA